MADDKRKPKPSIDERLEAIAQHLELLSSLHQDLDRETSERFNQVSERFSQIAGLFAQTDEFIRDLAHIAKDHERRLEDLESSK
jgi:hypothetical protein